MSVCANAVIGPSRHVTVYLKKGHFPALPLRDVPQHIPPLPF